MPLKYTVGTKVICQVSSDQIKTYPTCSNDKFSIQQFRIVGKNSNYYLLAVHGKTRGYDYSNYSSQKYNVTPSQQNGLFWAVPEDSIVDVIGKKCHLCWNVFENLIKEIDDNQFLCWECVL